MHSINLEHHLYDYLKQHDLLECSLAVGYSGGVDSTALLLALKTLYTQGVVLQCPRAVYIRHGIRPVNETTKEEETLIKNCIRFSIPLTILEGHSNQLSSFSSETDARTYRFQLFNSFLQSTNTPLLLTAHHLDDDMEFQLLRISKGHGWKSFLGIVDQQSRYRKPFLTIPKALLETYVLNHPVIVSFDSTNQSPRIERNVIRNTILPAWTKATNNLTKAFENNKEKATLLSHYISTQVSKFHWIHDFEQVSTKLPKDPIHPYLVYELVLQGIQLLEESKSSSLALLKGFYQLDTYGAGRKERKNRISLEFLRPIIFGQSETKIQGHGLEITKSSDSLIIKGYLAYSSEYGYSFPIEAETHITTPHGTYLGNGFFAELRLNPLRKSQRVTEIWLPLNQVRCSSYVRSKKQEPNRKIMSIFTHKGNTLGYLCKDESGAVSFNSTQYSDSISMEKAIFGFIPFTYGDEK